MRFINQTFSSGGYGDIKAAKNDGVCDGVVMRFGLSVKAMMVSLAAAFFGTGPALADQEIRDVRFGVDGSRTRVVIETARATDFQAFTLDGVSDRLVVDMPVSSWQVSGLDSGEGIGHGVVDGFRFFNNSQSSSRVIFELEHPVVIASQFALDPAVAGGNHRLVVDLVRSSEEEFRSASGFHHAVADLDSLIAERVEAVYIPPVRERRVIVIDAGHGGHDPGAVSRNGTRESDVNLSAARELRDQLVSTGRYDVYMTRENDTYPSWEQRIGVMAQVRADLFISLHADSSRSSSTRGAAVYTLNDRAENRARNRARSGPGHTSQADVNNILVELELREKRNQSSVFAESLLDNLGEAGPLLQNPHRQANFFVLLDSRVPAVLMEMGFLTNAADERNLNSPSARRRQMAAVTDSIDDYFANRGDSGEPSSTRMAALPAR